MHYEFNLVSDCLLIRESSHASDVLWLVVVLLLPSINVHQRPLAAATIVTQLVTQLISNGPRQGLGSLVGHDPGRRLHESVCEGRAACHSETLWTWIGHRWYGMAKLS
jgi:hypothetical protein